MRALNILVILFRSSLHCIVIIMSVHLLLLIYLPFQLIGFSYYYSIIAEHSGFCALLFSLRNYPIFNPNGKCKGEKNRKKN